MAATVQPQQEKTLLMTEGSIWKSILLFSVPLILGTLLQQHAAGDTLSITVAREGQMQTVSLTLGEKNAQTQQAQKNS